MDAMTKAAFEAVKAAVKDRPVGNGSLANVDPRDVVTLALAVKSPTEITAGLKTGAENAMKDGRGVVRTDKKIEVWQLADQLRHLLEAVGAGE